MLAHTGSLLGQIHDGLWNNQPWELTTLIEKVAQKEPAALAEKAYCMRAAWSGFAPNKDDELQLIQAAYDAKSPLAIVLMSRCYIYGYGVEKNQETAGKYLQEALDSEHPLALNYLANCLLDGKAGLTRNLKKGMTAREDAIAKGVLISEENYCLNLFQGDYSYPKDLKKAISISAAKVRQKSHGSMFHLLLLRAVEANSSHPALKDEALLQQAEDIVTDAANLGHRDAIYRLADYLVKTGRQHEAVPFLLRAARKNHSTGLRHLLRISTGGSSSRRYQSVAQYSTMFQVARLAWDAGSRSPLVSETVAESYLYKWGKEDQQPLKALPILQHQLKEGENVHNLLGTVYLQFDNVEHNPERGEAHFIYSISRGSKWALHPLLDGYFGAPKRGQDLAKARTAALIGLKYLSSDTRQAKIKGRLKQIEDKITPENMKRSEALLKEGWPLSQKFVDQSVATLIEYGDLPKGAKAPQIKE